MTNSEHYVQLGRFAAERLDNRWPVAEDELGSVRSGIFELLQVTRFRIKYVELLSKRDQIEIRQSFTAGAESMIQILPICDERLDGALNIHGACLHFSYGAQRLVGSTMCCFEQRAA
jgi:hypothetical protein